MFAHIVHCADVRVIERRSNPGFSLEAINRGAIGREFFGKELQRDFAAKARVDRAIDHSHASAPELIDDAVVRRTE